MINIPELGNSFSVKLPLTNLTKTTDRGINSHKRILVVDDEEPIALALKEGLESLLNCTVTTARDGAIAIKLCKQQIFDLIITDYKMPVADGLTLTHQIRQIAPQTKIILISAYIDEHLQQTALLAGVQRLLQKPFKLEDIRRVASDVLTQYPNE